MKIKSLSILPLALLSACATVRESYPSRTATEQMLISEATELAAHKLKLAIPEGRRAFLDITNFEGVDARYAVSAIRESLMVQGIALVETREQADTIIEIRAGALSIDSKGRTIIIPGLNVSAITPDVEANLAFSQLSHHTDQGMAIFRAFAYDRATGKLLAQAEMAIGQSKRAKAGK